VERGEACRDGRELCGVLRYVAHKQIDAVPEQSCEQCATYR
jgi:hypothetical protein